MTQKKTGEGRGPAGGDGGEAKRRQKQCRYKSHNKPSLRVTNFKTLIQKLKNKDEEPNSAIYQEIKVLKILVNTQRLSNFT